MELLSGNLHIVEIGKINKKKIRRYVAPDLKMPVYIHTLYSIRCFNTETVFF